MIIQTISKETRAAASRTVDLVLTRRNLLLQSNKKTPAFQQMPSSGGDEGDRTPYLLNAIQALSQVSYTPMTYSLFVGVRFCAARTPK